MISFYPGPSRVDDQVPAFVAAAHRAGVLSMNHRSDAFIALSKTTIGLLRTRLGIPRSYHIFFVSSATECWEIIAQSLIAEGSTHLFNGAFGEKWFRYTEALCPDVVGVPFDPNESLITPDHITGEVICVTQNETSNGTQLTAPVLHRLRNKFPQHLIAVDATSSMAGVTLNFKDADIWFASTQKCFGLPAGLGLLICSPRAIDKAQAIGENNHYNSLIRMEAMMRVWQTTYTPNVLAIYLLMRILKKRKSIREVNAQTISRYRQWQSFLDQTSHLNNLVSNPKVRSHTVLCLTAPPLMIQSLKHKARQKGFVLGNGYGSLKKDTFRIANFPSLRAGEISALRSFLKKTLTFE